MISKIDLEQDNALKRLANTPRDQKPRFEWGKSIGGSNQRSAVVHLSDGSVSRTLEVSEIAERVGGALTDLLLAREEESIFTEGNRMFVARITGEVTAKLGSKVAGGGAAELSQRELDLLIEKALIENEAFDVAKSLIFGRPETAQQGSDGEDLDTSSIRLIRRNGQVVPWNTSKIEVAVRKAFLSLGLDSEPAVKVAHGAVRRILEQENSFVHIEDLQDRVQEELMRQGHFKVAEAYILYRANRARQRQEQDPAEDSGAMQQSMVVVRKRSGETFFWDGLDLRRRVEFALIGLSVEASVEEIEASLRRSVHAEMNEDDLRKTIILNAKSLIEDDADYSRFAGRILLSYIYEEVLGWNIIEDGVEGIREAHQRAFRRYLKRGVELDRLNPELLDYDLEKMLGALDPSADLDFDYLGIQTLYDRYLIVDKQVKPNRRLETPQFFWMRVAMGLFLREKDGREDHAIELYNLYKSRRFCSSTPTLFNSGTRHSQLSSCYLYKVDDSIESIMYRGIAENAFLSKWAGGLGGSWTSVRGTGSYIKGTNGESQGIIPFLKLHNDQLVAVNQGGKRRGSGCAYLETWHNDILDFLELRKNTGDDRRRTHDMNTANWIPDLFMKRMESRGDWTLFRASDTPDLHDLYGKAFEERYQEYEARAERGEIFGKRMPAIDLWKQMLKMLFETGHPWITFKDPCNIRSPQDHAGVIHSSNLCTEITLNTSAEETAVCNLGSVVLDSHLTADGQLDHEKLRATIRVAVRALDNVIDINFYPTEAARRSNSLHRPIGLGVMGLANALYLRGESFDSEGAINFNDEFMEAIAYYAYEASSDLAAELGTYSSYAGSKWDRGILPQDSIELLEVERGEPIEVERGGKLDWSPLREKIARQGMRNSNVLAIAPTATISNIMGSSPCIEPAYKNLFVRSNLSGDFVVLNSFLVRDLKAAGLWSREMRDQLKYFDGELEHVEGIPQSIRERYRTAFTVPHDRLLDAAARRQKWIDQAQSLNLFIAEPNLKTLSHMYRKAWKVGLKTTYYLRSLGASNIEKATVSVKKEVRGVAGQVTVTGNLDPVKQACSIEAMMNGGTCESCQ
ncbi:MAG: ribonucleoside-diphosphate reductase subunit alpha [Puniceicoccaceae bacterium]